MSAPDQDKAFDYEQRDIAEAREDRLTFKRQDDKTLDPIISCPRCDGSGSVPIPGGGTWFGKAEGKCGCCNGKGKVRHSKWQRKG